MAVYCKKQQNNNQRTERTPFLKMKKRVSKEDLNKILINVDKYCFNNIETNVYLRTENRKGAMLPNNLPLFKT